MSERQSPHTVITRLAPSPTGFLHLGNAWSFLVCWLAARSGCGKIWLRIDDIDPQRSKPQYANAIIEDLRWLGLDWDWFPESGNGIIRQSQRGKLYSTAIDALVSRGLVYPCFCTRKELRMLANAPHIGDEGVPYPGTCAKLSKQEQLGRMEAGAPFSLRLRCPEKTITFADLLLGTQSFSPMQSGGDFPLKRSDGVWAYQLASVVDDLATGVNLVVRGNDLLPSTPRQIILAKLLNGRVPEYAHIPLLLTENGERLAKRHKSVALRALREKGIEPGEITGFLARLAGIHPDGSAISPGGLLPKFSLQSLPRTDILIRLPATWV